MFQSLFSKPASPSPCEEGTAQPFIKIVDKKLKLVGALPITASTPVRVISILGKARMGKSTFLNTMVSSVSKGDRSIFQTQDNDEHCTRGIDFYYLKEANLLFLDSQGLAFEDASHDPALLLFLYLISDVIIFNERMMLQNEALKLLEPICTFVNYIDLEEISKPRLFFRISDGDLVKDPQYNLEKVLTEYPDQYQSIRESIRHLFHSPLSIVKTESLDKKAKSLLAARQYLDVLADSDTGFQGAIETIMASLHEQNPSGKPILGKLAEIIDQINSNEHIKIEKLDIVKTAALLDMKQWRNTMVDIALYSSITVDGTQESYEANVEPRKAAKRATLTAFTKRFKGVAESIRSADKNELADLLNAPIETATRDSVDKAEERIKLHTMNAFADRELPALTSLSHSFTSIQANFTDQYLKDFVTLMEACESVYTPVKEKYLEKITRVYDVYYDAIEQITQKERQEQAAVKTLLADQVAAFEESILDDIQRAEQSILLKTNTQLVEGWKERYLQATRELLQKDSTIQHRKLVFSVKGHRLIPFITDIPSSSNDLEIFMAYDLVKEAYANYMGRINGLVSCMEAPFWNALLEKKKSILHGFYFTSGMNYTNTILQTNPELHFIRPTHFYGMLSVNDGTFRPTMTKETYETCIHPLIEKVVNKYVKKGLLPPSITGKEVLLGTSLLTLDRTYENILYYGLFPSEAKESLSYIANIDELFKKSLKKVVCQEYVAKGEFLKQLTIS